MKRFIKNSYLFLIFFIILTSKDYVVKLFLSDSKIDIKDSYILKLEKEIDDIKLISDSKLTNNFYYAKVIYQNPYKPGYIMALINSNDIKVNDLAISNNTLIGVVSKVFKNKVEIKLLSSSDSIMQVMVNDCYGILKDNVISGLAKFCDINVGDEVYSSNLWYTDFKILIGTIKDKNYNVQYKNNMYDLNYLIIIGGN